MLFPGFLLPQSPIPIVLEDGKCLCWVRWHYDPGTNRERMACATALLRPGLQGSGALGRRWVHWASLVGLSGNAHRNPSSAQLASVSCGKKAVGGHLWDSVGLWNEIIYVHLPVRWVRIIVTIYWALSMLHVLFKCLSFRISFYHHEEIFLFYKW